MKKILVVLCLGLVVGCGSESNSNNEEEKCTVIMSRSYKNGNFKEVWCQSEEDGKLKYLEIKRYFTTGELDEKLVYDFSKTHRVAEEFHKNGLMQSQTHFLIPSLNKYGQMNNESIKDGVERKWNYNGKLMEETLWENDKWVYVKQYDTTGKLIVENFK